MYRYWESLLPGFARPVVLGDFFIGLLWLVAYSLFISALLAVPYNYLTRREIMNE
jgi:hypothetical protein